MIDQQTMRGGVSSTTRISEAIGRVWASYSPSRPSAVRTQINGDVVTCQLVDAVASFDRAVAAPGSHLVRPTLDTYKQDAIAAVVGVTRQRVTRLMSSHDRDTDVATEVFTLEPTVRELSQSDTRELPRRDVRRFGYGQTHWRSGLKG